jgi:hypothetical protein
MKKKEDELRQLDLSYKTKLEKAAADHSQEVKELKLSFRDDVMVIDKELTKQIGLKKQAIATLEQ